MRHDSLSHNGRWPTISVSRESGRWPPARHGRSRRFAAHQHDRAAGRLTRARPRRPRPGLAESGGGRARRRRPGRWPIGTPAAPVAGDGLTYLGLIPGDNEVRFVMRPTIPTGRRWPASPGRSRGRSYAPDASVMSDMSKMVVDMKTLKCQAPLSDARAQALLETDKYPTAEFVFQQAPGMTMPLPLGDTPLQFIGQQTVHGVTRPAQYTTAATFSPTDVSGHATTEHNLSAFG